MYTITQLAKMFHLSRSTILYYDSIGILKPQRRTRANYRVYNEKSVQVLRKICELRETGLSLNSIKGIVARKSNKQECALEKRLADINQEIQALRKQQHVILKILQKKGLGKNTRIVNKDQWIAFLKEAGLDEKGMQRWHMAYEKSRPEAHQDFLESLGLSEKEIKSIRLVSRKR